MPRSAIRSILVATDLTPDSDDVVAGAAQLAAQTGADLHIVHSVEVRGGPFWESAFDLAGLQTAIHDSRVALQQQLGRSLPEGSAAMSEKVDLQPAPIAILRRAREVFADLIVMGPHQSRLPGSHFLGTTAQSVVAEAAVPCLVTRGPLKSPLRRILFPVGEVDVERGLLEVAGAWLATLRRQQEESVVSRIVTELRVFHVVRSPDDWRDFSERFGDAIRGANTALDLHSFLHLRRSVAWNRSPAAEIVRVAEDLDTELIAMGVRGHGPLMRALLGSVSTAVLRNANAPVLLFPSRFCEHPLTSTGRRGMATAGIEVPRDADAEWHLMYLEKDATDDDPEAASVAIGLDRDRPV